MLPSEILALLKRTITQEAAGLEALNAALNGELGIAFEKAVELLHNVQGRIIVTGMGKSGHIGRKIAATLASTGSASYFVHPAEASHGDLGMIRPEDAVIAISWSGEAPELADIVAYTRRFQVPLIALTSRPQSALGKNCDIGLFLPIVQEACPNGLAPTTSTTMQLAAGDALAVTLLSIKGFTAQDFRQYHPGGKLGSRLRKVRDFMHSNGEIPIVPSDATLSQAIFEMTNKRFGITAVVDRDGNLIGVVSDGDVRRAFEKTFVDRGVHESMNTAPRTIAADSLAEEALNIMNSNKITSLFVIENEHFIGILHIHDLLHAGVA